jgi:K+-sensing histidine kinase KdpD
MTIQDSSPRPVLSRTVLAPGVPRAAQAALAVAAPLALAALLVPWRADVPGTDAALALLLVVVAVAARGHRLAGILAAVSAAAWFDFFLTMPYERFTITRRADIETTVLLLAIGVAVTEIAVAGRRHRAAAARRGGYLDGLTAAARAVAAGNSPAMVTDQVVTQLTGLLSLSRCRFQDGVAGVGHPARLRHDGQIVVGGRVQDIDRAGLPGDTDIELLAEAGGLLQGRFLLTPRPGARPSLEQRQLAAALADQAGVALAGQRSAGRRP